MPQDNHLKEFKERFKDELKEITDLDTLKEYYVTELAKRDKIIDELQKQNELILKSTFKNKVQELQR